MKSIEVHSEEGSFFILFFNGKFSCQAKLPSGSRDIGYMNDIPAGARPLVERAINTLRPSSAPYPAVLTKNPWEDGNFRLADLVSCAECPQYAS